MFEHDTKVALQAIQFEILAELEMLRCGVNRINSLLNLQMLVIVGALVLFVGVIEVMAEILIAPCRKLLK